MLAYADVCRYRRSVVAMRKMGIDAADQLDLITTIAALLHIGNIHIGMLTRADAC